MRNLVIILSLILFSLALSGSVIAPLSCDVIDTWEGDTCPELVVFRISDVTNAHAEVPSEANYGYEVCCTDDSFSLGTECDNGAVVLRLSEMSNAHVEQSDIMSGDYPVDACLSSDVSTSCVYTTDGGFCPFGYECLATISDVTNAHVAECDTPDSYGISVCCRTEDGQAPSINFVNPTPPNGLFYNQKNISIKTYTSDNNDHYTFTDFDNQLVLWMRMDDVDGSGNPLDLSSHANNGVKSGGAQQDLEGRFGKSFSFTSASDYITSANNPTLDIPENITVSLWFYPREFGTYYAVQPLRKWTNTADANYVMYYFGDYTVTGDPPSSAVGDIRFYANRGGTWGSVSGSYKVTQLNTWYHVVWTYNNNKGGQLYINGAPVGVLTSTTGTLAKSTSPLRIGFANSLIDDAIIFNRTLNESEVKSLYSSKTSQYVMNFTNTPDGPHTFRSYAVDEEGYMTSTAQRQVTIDTISPSLNFKEPPTPEDGGLVRENNFRVETETSDANDHYSFLDFEGSLRLWLTMDDVDVSGNPIDLSSYSNNGVKQGSPQQGQLGRFGKSMDFNGNDANYIQVPYSDTMEMSDEVTISYWAKVDSWRSQYFNFIAKGDGALWASTEESEALNIFYHYTYTPPKIFLSFCDNDGTHNSLGLTSLPGLGEWHHYLFTINSTHATAYVDGVFNADTPNTLKINDRDLDFNIGGKYRTMDGEIDDVLIFSKALNASEIKSLYSSQSSKYSFHFQGLNDDMYDFKAYSVDRAGNTIEMQRSATVKTNTAPVISFRDPTPADNSYLKENAIYVDMPTVDEDAHYSFLDLDRSLMIWLRMDYVDGSGNPLDLSTYGHTVTKQGNAQQVAGGKFGQGFDFNPASPSGVLNVAESTSLGFTNQVSYGAWFKADTLSQWAGIISRMREFTTGYNLQVGTAQKIACGGGNKYTNSNDAPVVGEWYHAVCVYDGTQMKLYVNGVLQTDMDTITLTPGPDPVKIGAFYTLPSLYFDGVIDEVFIFNRSLSEAEVKSIYDSSANNYLRNHTGLSQGGHTFKGHVVDSFGEKAETEERSVTTDTEKPIVNNAIYDQGGNPLKVPIEDVSSVSSIRIESSASDNASGLKYHSIQYYVTRNGKVEFFEKVCAIADPKVNNLCDITVSDFATGLNLKYRSVAEDYSGNRVETKWNFIVSHSISNFLVHSVITTMGRTYNGEILVRNMQPFTDNITLNLSSLQPQINGLFFFVKSEGVEGIDYVIDSTKKGITLIDVNPDQDVIVNFRIFSPPSTGTDYSIDLDSKSIINQTLTDKDMMTIRMTYEPSFPGLEMYSILMLFVLVFVIYLKFFQN